MPLTEAGKNKLLSTFSTGFVDTSGASQNYTAATRVYLLGSIPSASYNSYINRFASTEDFIIPSWTVQGGALSTSFIGQEKKFTVVPAPAVPGEPLDLTNVIGVTVTNASDTSYFTGAFANVFNFYSSGTLTVNTVTLTLA
jgi:hypothetical protein